MHRTHLYIAAMAIAFVLHGCWSAQEPEDPRTASLRDMLAYTPPSAQITIAAPTIQTLDAQLTKLNLYQNDTVREALRTAGLIAGMDNAENVIAIAEALHLDTEAPFTIHLRTDDQLENRDIVVMGVPIDPDAASAIALDVVGASESAESMITQGDRGAFAIQPGVIAIGSNAELLRECFENPVAPTYGSAESPPSSPESIAFLARLSAVSSFARVSGLSMIEDYMLSATGDRVIIETWVEGDNAIAAIHVPRDDATSSTPLTLAPLLPPACESFIGWRMSEGAKDALREQWLSSFPKSLEGDPLQTLAATQLESFLHALGDEVALGALGLESAQPQFVGMFRLRDSTQVATLLGALSPLFKEVAREGDTPIYGLPEQMGVPIAYAIFDDVLVLGPDRDLVAGGIIQMSGARPTRLYGGSQPPLDPEERADVRALLSQRFLADLVVPLVQSGGGDAGALALIELATRPTAIQIHAVNRDGWDRWSIKAIP